MAKKRIKSQMPIDTGEWLNSPRINSLSYEIRGIWLTMLCYMWESPTRGIMAHSNGKPYKKAQIQRELNVDPIALEILIESGLLAVDGNGAYYSPEILHRERISNIRRNAGRKGGESTKVKVFAPQHEPVPPQAPTVIEPPPEKLNNPTPAQEPVLFGSDEVPEIPPELTPEQKEKAEKAKKHKYGEFVSMTRDEYAKLCEKYGEEDTKGMIEILDNYVGSKGRKYKSHYRTILSWVVDSYYEKQQRYGTRPTTNAATAKPAGGYGATTAYATGAIPTAKGAGEQSGDEPEKAYAERF